jgi:regulator of sigma E protease
MIILGKIFYFIIAIGPLIFIHELGHFLFAKLFGVKVEKFSLGFGPKLIGKQVGETEYLLSAFPLGGYVKMFGEGGTLEGSAPPTSEDTEKSYDEESGEPLDDAPELTEEEKARSFAHKPPLARIAIVMAGPSFNIICAWLLYILLYGVFSTNGFPTVPTKVGEVKVNSPAERGGIRAGDVIKRINNHTVKQWEDIPLAIFRATPRPINIELLRGEQLYTITITPETLTETQPGVKKPSKRPVIGIVPTKELVIEPFSLSGAFIRGTNHTYEMIEMTLLSFKKLILREISLDNVGGPGMIAEQANAQAKSGILSFLAFMALLSINLGVLNLLPVPVLDGGHLFFYFCELVFRRPVSQKTREYAQQVGLFLLLSLMALAIFNDITSYF